MKNTILIKGICILVMMVCSTYTAVALSQASYFIGFSIECQMIVSFLTGMLFSAIASTLIINA